MILNDKELIAHIENGIVTVTLNRPEALNALTLEMIRILSSSLARWENDGQVKAVVFRGAGDRAFCAGGDVKAVYAVGMQYRRGLADERSMSLFFAEEYRLNRQLFHYKKPLIAVMDGITMGGGFGIAGPCRYRIATEKTLLAMPETIIGFFPDVGSTWFLNRCPGGAGAYLALTGNSIRAGDAVWSGLATHFMPSGSIPDFSRALEGDIESSVQQFSAAPDRKGDLQENRQCIDACFGHDTVEDILAALHKDQGAWAKSTAATLESRSPVGLKVSLAHLRRAKGEDFDAVIARDFSLVQHFMKGHDFYEGVRAALLDKDKSPQWVPARVSGVTEAEVDRYFHPAALDLGERAA